jgi:hypothetical protein
MASTADYAVVIRDLKARREVLDAAITALERVLPIVSANGNAALPAVPEKQLMGTVSRESPEVKESGKEQN